MRILIVIAVLLIALVAGGLVAVSRLVVWDDYRDELTARAEAMTGQSVAIQGRIDLNLLPQPTLTLGQTTFASAADAARLEIERLISSSSRCPCSAAASTSRRCGSSGRCCRSSRRRTHARNSWSWPAPRRGCRSRPAARAASA